MGDSELFALATLDSLSAHIAIVAVNRAWREFARSNGAADNISEGADYLDVCDSATGAGAEYAAAFAEGARSALAGCRGRLSATRTSPGASWWRRRWSAPSKRGRSS